MATVKAEIQGYAKKLGWKAYRNGGKHPIWISPSGYKMAIPSSKIRSRAIAGIKAKLRRYQFT